jgi:hypothetical protein
MLHPHIQGQGLQDSQSESPRARVPTTLIVTSNDVVAASETLLQEPGRERRWERAI